MPSAEERERTERSDSHTQATNRTGLPDGYLDDVSRVIEIYRTIEKLDTQVGDLRDTAKSHTEEIKQLTQRVYAISSIRKDIARNTSGLNQLEKQHGTDLKELEKKVNGLGMRLDNRISELRTNEVGKLKSFVDTAKTLGYIALTLAGVIGVAIAGYLFQKR
jgi:ABC-type transporter Mla subunit MlaD